MFTRKRDLISIFYILFSFSLLASVRAFAAPVIEPETPTTLSHGSTVTITGSGFGTKISGQAAPIRFDDFEDGVLGQPVTSTGWWEWGGKPSLGETVFDNKAVIPAGSGISTRHNFSDKHIRWHSVVWPNDTDYFYKKNVGFAATGKAYVNLWVYLDYVAGDDFWHLKLIVMNPAAEHATDPSWKFYLWTSDSVVTNWVATTVPVTVYAKPDPSKNDNPTEGYWWNVAFQYRESSDFNVADGEARIFFSMTPFTKGPYYKSLNTDLVTRTLGDAGPINAIGLGYYLAGEVGGKEGNTYWDDIYIDNSWARVEVGDASTYNACTHREIQIPSTWSDNSITVRVNQGFFANGKQVYLFVVDEDGTVSDGYGPIVFGSGSGLPITPVNFK